MSGHPSAKRSAYRSEHLGLEATATDLLAPGFLLAPPPLEDPHFDRTLVLLALHEEQGSMGFIVNRLGDATLHELLKELDITPRVPDRRVLLGGPVSASSGFILYEHEANKPPAPGIEVSPTISVSPSRELLEAGARGELPGRFDLVLGYAGWGPDQLHAELTRGSWMHAGFDSELLFDVAVESRWDEAYARLGVSPSGFVNVRGGAQA